MRATLDFQGRARFASSSRLQNPGSHARAVVYVARGTASVTAKGGRVEVKAGEQATIHGDQAPKTAPVALWDDWTGGMADLDAGGRLGGAGSGTLYGVDEGAPRGSVAQKLELSRQAVRAVVRDGLSETEVDQTFFNPGERAVEGWYWFTVPERASVTGFALETNGTLVEGELIESKEATAQYGAAKSSGHSPAILEWVHSHTYRARIYPIAAGGSRRVVVRYIELRPILDQKLLYTYPMAQREPVRIGEFSLVVDLGESGKSMKITTLADARVEEGGQKVTMRRSGYTPRADFQLEAELGGSRPALTVTRFPGGTDSADYVMARYAPDIDWTSTPAARGDVVVVVDTSAAGDDTSRQLKTATAEAILRSLSAEDRFALLSLDTKPTVLFPKDGLAPAADQEITKALEALADHATGGATDLAALFEVALRRLHGTEQPAIVYVGDGLATSGELSGEQLTERLRRVLGTSRARLFTVAVGTEADQGLLSELGRAGGGASFQVDDADQTTAQALELIASLKAPTLTELEIDLGAGLDEPFTTHQGKVTRGGEVIVLARTHHELPREVKVRGRVGGAAFEKTYPVATDKTVLKAFVPRFWAAEYVRRLLGSSPGPDTVRGRIVALGIEYGLMTPYTSFLALENEAAYRDMGIVRQRSRLRGTRLTSLDPVGEWRLLQRLDAPALAPRWAVGCALNKRETPEELRSKSSAVGMTEARAPSQQENKDGPGALAASPAAAEPAARAEDQGPASAGGLALLGDEAKGGGAMPTGGVEAPVAQRARAASLAAEETGAHRGGREREREEGSMGNPLSKAINQRSAQTGSSAPPTPLPLVAKPADPLELATCSDAAARPLAERVLLWRKRLRTAKTPNELLERYQSARRGCELQDWRAERTFLELLEKRVDSEASARIVLSHFASRRDVQKHLAKMILRRAVDRRLSAAVEAVLFGTAVQWDDVDRKLSEIAALDQRIAKLRELGARAPDDPNATLRLVRMLVEAGQQDEAVALGRRLRDQGLMTPLVARAIGDALARAGLESEAVRTYSEIVEFDPDNGESRRLLGDIYLGHGWYEPAYRQYKTLTDGAPNDALGWLRLAAAAAGTGRVDEALRLERHVANAQGTPGPRDPRRWARLLSASRLARLLQNPPAASPGQDRPTRLGGIQRELKQLALFSGPGTLLLLTWEDLSHDLLLVTRRDTRDVVLGDTTDAAPAGLSAVLLAPADTAQTSYWARVRSVPAERPLLVRRQDIHWDGKEFRVESSEKTLAARATELAI
jgi:Ca-activated chloride channel family protein